MPKKLLRELCQKAITHTVEFASKITKFSHRHHYNNNQLETSLTDYYFE